MGGSCFASFSATMESWSMNSWRHSWLLSQLHSRLHSQRHSQLHSQRHSQLHSQAYKSEWPASTRSTRRSEAHRRALRGWPWNWDWKQKLISIFFFDRCKPRGMGAKKLFWNPPFHENFGRLVLGCIGTSESWSRRLFQHFEIYQIRILHRSEF